MMILSSFAHKQWILPDITLNLFIERKSTLSRNQSLCDETTRERRFEEIIKRKSSDGFHFNGRTTGRLGDIYHNQSTCIDCQQPKCRRVNQTGATAPASRRPFIITDSCKGHR